MDKVLEDKKKSWEEGTEEGVMQRVVNHFDAKYFPTQTLHMEPCRRRGGGGTVNGN